MKCELVGIVFEKRGLAWCGVVNGFQVCLDSSITSSKLAASEIEFARNFKPENARPPRGKIMKCELVGIVQGVRAVSTGLKQYSVWLTFIRDETGQEIQLPLRSLDDMAACGYKQKLKITIEAIE